MGQRYELKIQMGKDVEKMAMPLIEESFPEIFNEDLGYGNVVKLDNSIVLEVVELPWDILSAITAIVEENSPKYANNETDAYHYAYVGDEGSFDDAWNGDDYFAVYPYIHTEADEPSSPTYA